MAQLEQSEARLHPGCRLRPSVDWAGAPWHLLSVGHCLALEGTAVNKTDAFLDFGDAQVCGRGTFSKQSLRRNPPFMLG